MTSVIARRSKPRFAALWDRTGKLNGLVEESHTGHALLLAFGQRQSTIDEFGRQNEQLRETSFRAWFLPDVITPAVQFLANVNFVAIAALSAFQVVTGVITFGAAQAFIQYSRRRRSRLSRASWMDRIPAPRSGRPSACGCSFSTYPSATTRTGR